MKSCAACATRVNPVLRLGRIVTETVSPSGSVTRVSAMVWSLSNPPQPSNWKTLWEHCRPDPRVSRLSTAQLISPGIATEDDWRNSSFCNIHCPTLSLKSREIFVTIFQARAKSLLSLRHVAATSNSTAQWHHAPASGQLPVPSWVSLILLLIEHQHLRCSLSGINRSCPD